MERLTVETEKGAALKMADNYTEEALARWDLMVRYRAAVARLAAYEDTGLEPEEIAALVQAEKDGRLVVLPAPVGKGKLAYAIPDSFSRNQEIFTIECERLDSLEIWENPGHEVVVVVDGCEIGESDIGKTVFLTREEAEAALKKREESI